nr:wall-associated receptor kinase-like 8 [Quercus suber]
MSLEGSPFHFSGSYNTFISVGCDNFATVSGIAPTVFGCISDCTNTNIRETYISNCTGFMCCESTNVPSNLQEFAVDFRTISESISESTERSENCKFAFLVVKDRLLSNNSVKYSDDVPVVLEWAILKQTKNSPVMIRSLKYRHDVICNFSSNTFHCACASGYEGNPYLSTGCEGTHL